MHIFCQGEVLDDMRHLVQGGIHIHFLMSNSRESGLMINNPWLLSSNERLSKFDDSRHWVDFDVWLLIPRRIRPGGEYRQCATAG